MAMALILLIGGLVLVSTVTLLASLMINNLELRSKLEGYREATQGMQQMPRGHGSNMPMIGGLIILVTTLIGGGMWLQRF